MPFSTLIITEEKNFIVLAKYENTLKATYSVYPTQINQSSRRTWKRNYTSLKQASHPFLKTSQMRRNLNFFVWQKFWCIYPSGDFLNAVPDLNKYIHKSMQLYAVQYTVIWANQIAANNFILKISNRKRCGICSKLTTKSLE